MAGATPNRESSREASDAVAKLLAELEHFRVIEPSAGPQRELTRRMAAEVVQPLIDEREEAVSRQFELEEGWRARIARFLRRLSRLVEES